MSANHSLSVGEQFCFIPPNNSNKPASPISGIWVSAQWQHYKLLQDPNDPSKPRRSGPLTQQRIKLLNELSFAWTIRSRDNIGELSASLRKKN